MEDSAARKIFEPLVLAKISNLVLRARYVVDGVLSGLHSSHFKGSSVEFCEHRQYFPGDDLKRIDWKAYGKLDRYFVKEYEEDTNLKGYLLLDCSSSMAYGSNGVSKFDYGCTLAASLAYMMLRQQDSVGLVAFSESILRYIPPRSGLDHISSMARALQSLEPSGQTHFREVLHEIMGSVRRRSLLLVISDLLGEQSDVLRGLQRLRHKKNEVLVIQILDPCEIDFAFDAPTLFDDLEAELKVQADPLAIKDEYIKAIKGLIEVYKNKLRAHDIEYALFRTDVPLDKALVRFLSRRS